MASPSTAAVERHTIHELLEQVRRLVKRYREAVRENEDLRSQVHILNREISALRDQVQQLEAERDAIRMQITDLIDEINQLELE